MPLDHFLPATYIAGFSTDRNPIRRDRRVWVGDKRTGKVFEAPASRVCAIKNFYTLEEPGANPARMIDQEWAFFEASFATAIERLIAGRIDANTWLTVLVRFVSGLLVRGPDFNHRFLRRFFGSYPNLREHPLFLHAITRRDNINHARLFEHQRLLAPVAGARWCVLSTSGNVSQIASDLGFIGFGNPQTGARGMAVPLDQHHVLTLTPRIQANLAIARGNEWVPELYFDQLSDWDHMTFSSTVGATAQRFVFGPRESVVRSHLIKQEMPPFVPDPADLGFIAGREASVHEMLFFQLLTLTATPPHHPAARIYIDFSKKIERAKALGRWVDID